MWGHSKMAAVWKPGRPEPDHAGTLIADLWLPEPWENNFFVKPSSLWHFVTAAHSPTWQRGSTNNSHKSSAQFLIWLFAFWLLSYISCSYTLEMKPLLVTSFVNIFSWSVGCFFILFKVSFAVLKLTNLTRSCLFTFIFISVAFGDWPKKTLVQFMSENLLPILSSRKFMVSCVVF